MAIWNVLVKDTGAETETRVAEAVAFVRERPFVLAFLFPVLALLRFRLWLGLVAYLVLAGLLAVMDALVDMPALELAAALGLHLLVALELSSLRVAKLRRQGYQEAGAVSARTREEAERRFFKRHDFAPLGPSVGAEVLPPRAPRRGPVTGIIGSFPEPRAS